MIQSIADHIKKAIPVYVVSIFLGGFTVFGTVVVAWYNINRDLQLLKCKVGIDDNTLCRWTSTIAEDLAKVPDEPTED